jgi:hypothetical protein
VDTLTPEHPRVSRVNLWIVLASACGTALIIALLGNAKFTLYVDALERSGLLYAIPLIALAGLIVVLRYPRLMLHVLAFLLPFNFVGGYWSDSTFILMAKIAVVVCSAVAVLTTFVAPWSQRAWITGTRLGWAAIAWIVSILSSVAIGFLGSERGYWVRESSWILFFAAVLPFGTLLRHRRDIVNLMWSLCGGVAVLQLVAFWQLATGRRYDRADAWESGATFFRAAYSCESLFVLYLAAAALFYYAARKELTAGKAAGLSTVIAVLGGGLLASMTRSLWLSAVVGIAVLLTQVNWNRRVARASLALAAGALVSLTVVAAVDRMSAESSGNWLGGAGSFLMDLTSKDSTSRVTRVIEWSNAIDAWRYSPFVGLGWGYAFPEIDIGKVTDVLVPDLFFMHNSYLNILAKAGLFGLAALVYLTWRAVVVARALGKREGADGFDQILAQALVATIIQTSFLSLTMPVLTAGDGAAFFGMLVGLTAAAWRTAP